MALRLALRDGKAKALGIKLLLFGAENVGKTCVAATLVGDPFQNSNATQGSDIQICNASDWKKITKEEAHQRLQNEYFRKLKASAKRSNTTAQAITNAEKVVESVSTKQEVDSDTEDIADSDSPFHHLPLAEEKKQAASNIDTDLTVPEVAPEDIAAVQAFKEKRKNRFKLFVTKLFKKGVVKNGIDVTILDFAGQVQYHNTHSIFIRKENVIMIVFNAAQPLSTNVKVRSSTPLKDSMTYSQNIHFWMKTVHSTCHEPGDDTDKASLLPVIMLVATHTDLLEGSVEDAKEEIIQILAKELEGKPYAKHLAGHGEGLLNALRKYCIFLSNKVRSQKLIHQLQDIIMEVSSPILSKEHPLVYLKIERELLGMEQGVITVEQFHEVAQRCGFLAAIDSEEFAYALVYFHNNGTVLHFASIESLRKLVILSPHWLTKMLSYLLIAHPYKTTGNGLDISFNTLNKRGILLESFLSYMLDCFNKSGVVGHQIQQNEAVDLMKWFGFMAQISPKTKILDKAVKIVTEEIGFYIVPSLLPDDEKGPKGLPEKDDRSVRIVYYHFPDEFLPPMLFSQVAAMCINRNEEKREDLVWLRKSKVKIVLDSKQDYCVSLCEEMSSIQLSFLLHEKDSSAEHRYQLFQYLQSKISVLMHNFMNASTKPEIYIPCYYHDCNELHVELQLAEVGSKGYCPIKEKPIPADHYFDLFHDKVSDEVVSTVTTTATVSQIDTVTELASDSYANEEPQMWDLIKIVIPTVKSEWEYLAYALEYNVTAVRGIKRDCKDSEDCCKTLFEDWLTTDHGVSPKTWSTLLQKIQQVDELFTAVDSIRKELNRKFA